MKLNEMFVKDINRNIDGVVKVDNRSTIALELDEYVVTRELERHLEDFLSAYNEGYVNGAWLSGFFGSGKSHLLKMLAVILENKPLEDGRRPMDIFMEKCQANALLKGQLQKAQTIPSQSILFNIDSKTALKSTEPVLSVFLKVFNEACGYCPQFVYVAQFERELDEDGHLEAFEEAFLEITGVSWSEKGRVRTAKYVKDIDAAYQRTTGKTVENIIKAYEANYKPSIEDFAKTVRHYIDQQCEKHGPHFRLNFFVDEVGQYIAEDTKLMLNIQTIAENLNTVCENRAWLIVTSQTDLSEVIGTVDKQKKNDFSKIAARFPIKPKLTGSDTNEVIRRRLLDKTPDATICLSDVYGRFENDFKTMYDFVDGSKSYKAYEGCEHFISLYPFANYQFDLFRSAMENLSSHECFTGSHQSTGARSVLAVCKESVLRLNEQSEVITTQVVPFDYWYESIDNILRPAVTTQITVAKNQLDIEDKPLAIRLLKVLLMVKYVTEFKATIPNLLVLMIDDFACNRCALTERIKAVLDELENQSYVQRKGATYEYLTDEEKDIDKEIRNVEVDNAQMEKMYKDLFFDAIIKASKLDTFSGAQHLFQAKINDHTYNTRTTTKLAINLITSSHGLFDRLQDLKNDKLGLAEVTIVLPNRGKLARDIRSFLQTRTYVTRNAGLHTGDPKKSGIIDIRRQNNDMLRDAIEKDLRAQISEATILIRGEEESIRAQEAKARVQEAFARLAEKVYVQYPLIDGFKNLTERDIDRYLKKEETLPGMNVPSSAEVEIKNYIQRAISRASMRLTILSVLEHFEDAPYGWPMLVSECLLAKLITDNAISLADADGELTTDQRISAALKNSRLQGTTNIQLAYQVEPQKVRKFKDFVKNYFDVPVSANDAKGIAHEFLHRMETMVGELDATAKNVIDYPFLTPLVEATRRLKVLTTKPYTWFYEEAFIQTQDELFNEKEYVIDAILSLYNREDFRIAFKSLTTLLQTQQNDIDEILSSGATCFSREEIDMVKAALIDCQLYSKRPIQQKLQALNTKIKQAILDFVDEKRNEILQKVTTAEEELHGTSDYVQATDVSRAYADDQFTEVKATLHRTETLLGLKVFLNDFNTVLLPKIYNSLEVQPPPQTKAVTEPQSTQPTTISKTISINQLLPTQGKPLDSMEAFEAYLEGIRERGIEILQQGGRIII